MIAILRQEPDSEVGEHSLKEASISTVNLVEVATYLARNSLPTGTSDRALAAFPIEVVPLNREQDGVFGSISEL